MKTPQKHIDFANNNLPYIAVGEDDDKNGNEVGGGDGHE